MIKIDFSQEDIASLHHERFHHPHPAIRKRMDVVYLKSQGLKHKEISRLCRLSKDSVTQYLKMYRDGGLEGLKKWDYFYFVTFISLIIKKIRYHACYFE